MLSGISSLIASAKTDKERQEYEYQKECIERTIDMHKKSQSIYRKLYNSIKEIEVNGTEDGEHPETISFGDYRAKIIRASNLPDNAVKALENAKLANPQMYELDAEAGGAKLFHNLMETTKISNKHAAAVISLYLSSLAVKTVSSLFRFVPTQIFGRLSFLWSSYSAGS